MNKLAARKTVSQLLKDYAEIVIKLKKFYAAVREINEAGSLTLQDSDLARTLLSPARSYLSFNDLDEAKKKLDSECWQEVVKASKISEVMSKTAAAELFRNVRDNPPEFCKEEIDKMLRSLEQHYFGSLENLFKEVYNYLVGCKYESNAGDGVWYKQDNLKEVKNNFRIRWGNIYWDHWDHQRIKYNHWETQNNSLHFEDLFTVFKILDGKLQSDYSETLVTYFERSGVGDYQIQENAGFKLNTIETPYFDITVYKNGNKKIKVKRLDLLSEFNKIGSGTYRLPDIMKKRYKPEHFDNQEPEADTQANGKLDFYETPAPVAERLKELAEQIAGETILEPSAGKGAIAQYFEGIHCIEISNPRTEELLRKGFKVVSDQSFLQFNKRYDLIVANPPFNKQQDIDHVLHMIKLANRRVVSVMSRSFTFRINRKSVDFRRYLESLNARIEDLPEKSFKESRTDVDTCIVVIDK